MSITEVPTKADRARGAMDWLDDAAAARAAAGLHRTLSPRLAASDLLNLASNDYLGLATNRRVVAAAHAALDLWGTGATSSRLVTGTTEIHASLERDLADFLGYEAALVFSSGYTGNLGAISSLMGRGDLIVSDGGAHASLIDGCRLSRARVVVVNRGDTDAVRRHLEERSERRAMVVTDSVYSVDGRTAPVSELYCAAQDTGAVLLVDEAHAIGVRGIGGRGVLNEVGLAGAPNLVVTAVLSKSLGAQGGVVLGTSVVRDHLIDRARTFIFDTGLAPAAAGSAQAALAVLREQPDLAERVRANAVRLAKVCGGDEPQSAVISIVVGDPIEALAAAHECRDMGVLVGCFRPPSVPPGTSRLRLTARADLTDTDIDRVGSVVRSVLDRRSA